MGVRLETRLSRTGAGGFVAFARGSLALSFGNGIVDPEKAEGLTLCFGGIQRTL